MTRRTLGTAGPTVSALGLGCMGMSDLYGPADRAESLATIAAVDAGVTSFDTGDFYGMGHNELLLAEGLAGRPRHSYQLSVKFGVRRAPSGQVLGVDNRPASVQDSLAYSLRRLGVDTIDVYRPARLDPAVPIEDTVGAIAEMVTAGYAGAVGLSEVGPDTLRRAHAVHPISDLQIEYSLFSRGIETEILPTCRELGFGITAYGVLSRGLLSGHWTAERATADFRAGSPRFQGDNLTRNLALVDALRAVAAAAGVTVAQLAVAWVLDRGDDVATLAGPRRRDRLAESVGALDVHLDDDLRASIEAAVPAEQVAGAPLQRSRHGHPGQRTLTVVAAGQRRAPLQAEDVLDATEQVLRRHGPAKATVVDVSRALGVSHGSIYRHFPSKQALRRAVTERWLHQVIEPLAAHTIADRPALERARRWFEALNRAKAQLAADDPDLFATYLELLDDTPEMIEAHVTALLSQLETIVEQGAADRSMYTDDPATTARALFHAMSRFHHPRHAAYWAHPDLDRHLDEVWTLLVEGLHRRRRRM